MVENIVNVVGASCKRRDILREKRAAEVIENLQIGELSSGQGLNQETALKRADDTRWSSHYGALINIYSSTIYVLEIVVEDGFDPEQRAKASTLLDSMQSFDFAFCLHLMIDLLGITHELSQALQRKDQDIVNAMALVKIAKQRMQTFRDDGWDTLIDEVLSFCVKHDIIIPNMDDVFVARGRPRHRAQEMTNLHHYRIELFYTVIDMQVLELNDRFTELSTELLLYVACLNPSNSFSAYDKQKLVRLAEFYPTEFSTVELKFLDNQLQTYIIDMRSNNEFSEVKGIAGLAEKMVETKKDILYPLIYLLVTLVLTLPVATAIVERAFFAMNIVKN